MCWGQASPSLLQALSREDPDSFRGMKPKMLKDPLLLKSNCLEKCFPESLQTPMQLLSKETSLHLQLAAKMHDLGANGVLFPVFREPLRLDNVEESQSLCQLNQGGLFFKYQGLSWAAVAHSFNPST